MQEYVKTLINKYSTCHPIELAEKMNIFINYVDLGKDTLGLSQVERRIKIIHINNNIEDKDKNFIIAHELYHVLKHDHCNTHFLKRTSINVSDKLEREANEFATLLLANRFDDTNYEVVSTHDIIRECGIPSEYEEYLQNSYQTHTLN